MRSRSQGDKPYFQFGCPRRILAFFGKDVEGEIVGCRFPYGGIRCRTAIPWDWGPRAKPEPFSTAFNIMSRMLEPEMPVPSSHDFPVTGVDDEGL